MIRISDLDFSYGSERFSFRLDQLEIRSGEKIALIGPSGYGKTTLLRIIAGIVPFQAGNFTIGETNWVEAPERKKVQKRREDFGIVFQDFKLLPYLTVLENILINAPSVGREEALKVLDDLRIKDKAKSYPKQLSQGEQQRVAIARALIKKPGIILADEPTGNLDPETKQRAKSLIFEQCKATRSTLLFITHDMDLLDGFDRVLNCKEFMDYV